MLAWGIMVIVGGLNGKSAMGDLKTLAAGALVTVPRRMREFCSN